MMHYFSRRAWILVSVLFLCLTEDSGSNYSHFPLPIANRSGQHFVAYGAYASSIRAGSLASQFYFQFPLGGAVSVPSLVQNSVRAGCLVSQYFDSDAFPVWFGIFRFGLVGCLAVDRGYFRDGPLPSPSQSMLAFLGVQVYPRMCHWPTYEGIKRPGEANSDPVRIGF